MLSHVAQTLEHLLQYTSRCWRPGPKSEECRHRPHDVKSPGAEQHGGPDTQLLYQDPCQGGPQHPNAVPNQLGHSHGTDDVFPFHQSGKYGGQAWLIEGLQCADGNGSRQQVPHLDPFRHYQQSQAHHHRCRDGLGHGYQKLGFQTVGQGTADHVEGHGGDGDGDPQERQVPLLPGQLEHQPTQGEAE